MSHSMGLAGPALQASLSSGLMLAMPHLSISVLTHSGHVLRGLPFFLVQGSGKFVIDLIQDVARCTWTYHLSRWHRRIDVMSSMSSFSSNEAVGVLSVSDSTDPMDHGTVIAAKLPQFGFLWSPRFATMEHSWLNAGLVHLALYPGWEVSGG